jgi:hypothetical protein
VRWQFTANGPISGSPTIIAGRVYFATLNGTTYALDARSGRQVWSFPDGKYSPVVADSERLYLVGNAKLYGLVEKRSAPLVHRLNEAGALRVLRRGGLHRLRVVGVHPLAIHVGRPGGSASEHVCHLAVRGKRANVRRAGILLAKACG